MNKSILYTLRCPLVSLEMLNNFFTYNCLFNSLLPWFFWAVVFVDYITYISFIENIVLGSKSNVKQNITMNKNEFL